MQGACAAFCCHLWPLWLHHIFPHYLTNASEGAAAAAEGGVVEHKKFVFRFSLQLLSETLLILKRIKRDTVLHLKTSSSTRYCCHSLMELELSRQIFEKILNVKFYQNPSSGSSMRTDGQTYDAINRFSQLCE